MNKIMRYFLFSTLYFVSGFYSQALGQDDKEINYVWIDTVVEIEGQETRLVSSEITKITCCMKSPKYSKTSKKATKWIRENYDLNYQGDSPFKTLQDMSLASRVIDEAREESMDNRAVRMVDYEFRCK